MYIGELAAKVRITSDLCFGFISMNYKILKIKRKKERKKRREKIYSFIYLFIYVFFSE